ncbi:T9SS type A sorting domain-containing protein [Aequorivita sp. H23M31]|uniref:T9SS type A sorting domain-containing protein n=1 Tax=Aequorivita ciconiae TaxID=2494375 RepID=A0A410G1E9_9FLAO|nr:T9SS type A sorting domain-containing protein [Aequorivita sp. H23M31]QAA81092.1 T9SS type A sorting domain-containing protein [Aequorivita sp. H23M31]
MKKFLLLACVLASTAIFAQGHETFDNLDLTGNSYATGTFVGQDGVTWNYGEARGDIELNGKAITLGRNRQNPMFLESGTIPNGLGTLEFSYAQAFTKDVGMEVMVNGELVYTATSEGEEGVTKFSGPITVEVAGDIVLMFNNPQNFGQITIDDIIWTAYDDTTGIEDNSDIGFSYFPSPMIDVLNLNAKIAIEKIEAFNLLGQKVIDITTLNDGQMNVSNLPAGSYVFRVKFENGSQKTFNISKK